MSLYDITVCSLMIHLLLCSVTGVKLLPHNSTFRELFFQLLVHKIDSVTPAANCLFPLQQKVIRGFIEQTTLAPRQGHLRRSQVRVTFAIQGTYSVHVCKVPYIYSNVHMKCWKINHNIQALSNSLPWWRGSIYSASCNIHH